jgi:hypothetical protein
MAMTWTTAFFEVDTLRPKFSFLLYIFAFTTALLRFSGGFCSFSFKSIEHDSTTPWSSSESAAVVRHGRTRLLGQRLEYTEYPPLRGTCICFLHHQPCTEGCGCKVVSGPRECETAQHPIQLLQYELYLSQVHCDSQVILRPATRNCGLSSGLVPASQ